MKNLILLVTLFLSPAFAQSKVPVGLNHFYVILDAPDYKAIAGSKYLKEVFGSFEARTTKRTDKTYTGIYFYGLNTYMEFFNSADTVNNPAGNPIPTMSGIAFGVDHTGEAARIGGLQSMPVTRGYTDDQKREVQVPWFSLWQPPTKMSAVLATWLMEYDPGFLTGWHSEVKSPPGVSRSLILERYKGVIAKSTGIEQNNRLLGDVTELHVELVRAEIDSFLKTAAALGTKVERNAKQTVVRSGPQSIFLTEGKRNKIISAKMNLRKKVAPSELRFGKKTYLKFYDKTATWIFDGMIAL